MMQSMQTQSAAHQQHGGMAHRVCRASCSGRVGCSSSAALAKRPRPRSAATTSSSSSSSRVRQAVCRAAGAAGSGGPAAPGGGGGGSEFEGVAAGDPSVQDALLRQLAEQLETETLKEEIREDLKGKVEEMKAIGQDLISQLDAELGIEKFRTELESTQVLSEANDKFNELEEQLQQIKDQIQADQDDLRRFEAASAAARSQGLFFRNLYEAPGGEGDATQQQQQQGGAGGLQQQDGALLPGSSDARRAAAVVASSAEGEVASPFRLWLFGAMAAVLAVVVAQDLTTPEPSLPLDGLYAVLGLLLGVNALNERRALAAALQARGAGLGDADRGSTGGSTGSGSTDSSGSGSSGTAPPGPGQR